MKGCFMAGKEPARESKVVAEAVNQLQEMPILKLIHGHMWQESS